MRDRLYKRGRTPGPDQETVGHDEPVARGGDPLAWVPQCRGCNQEQGSRSFAQWAAVLAYRGDARAPRVAVLAGWVAEQKQRRKVA